MTRAREIEMDLADLYEESREHLMRYALALCHSLDRSDDLVQETFVRALAHAADLERMNRFQREAWLKRVLRNRFYDEQRAFARRRRQIHLLSSEHARPAANAGLPEFDALLDCVPMEHRQIFEMRYRLGMNSAEIAEQSGVPRGTVRYRLHECIQQLRMQLPQAT